MIQTRYCLPELPDGLRNNILEYSLSDLDILVEPPGCKDTKVKDSASLIIATALTMTCKQIYKEYSDLLYNLNANRFDMKIGRRRIAVLRWMEQVVRGYCFDCVLHVVGPSRDSMRE